MDVFIILSVKLRVVLYRTLKKKQQNVSGSGFLE